MNEIIDSLSELGLETLVSVGIGISSGLIHGVRDRKKNKSGIASLGGAVANGLTSYLITPNDKYVFTLLTNSALGMFAYLAAYRMMFLRDEKFSKN